MIIGGLFLDQIMQTWPAFLILEGTIARIVFSISASSTLVLVHAHPIPWSRVSFCPSDARLNGVEPVKEILRLIDDIYEEAV